MSGDNKVQWSKQNYNLLEYFWSTSVLSAKNEKNLPHLIKQADLFVDFSELEIFELTKYIHVRNFSKGEVVFDSDDYGIGFYIILSGSIEITSNSNDDKIQLYPGMYFGEKSLILEKTKRNVDATATNMATLAAILGPDLDNLISKNPKVAAKLIRKIAQISLKRLDEVERSLLGQKEG